MPLSMKRCDSFCYSVIITLFSSSTRVKFSSVIDSLLEGTPNSIILWIKIILHGATCQDWKF